jgi:hypothetical protein
MERDKAQHMKRLGVLQGCVLTPILFLAMLLRCFERYPAYLTFLTGVYWQLKN